MAFKKKSNPSKPSSIVVKETSHGMTACELFDNSQKYVLKDSEEFITI